MYRKAAVLFLISLAPLLAGDAPAGFVVWPKGMAPGGAPAKFANHQLSNSHRDKDGIPELHEKQTDIMVIQSGSADLLVGGTIADPKTTAPGEVRGTKINGGVRKTVAPGDVIHIPSKTPHQFFLKPGTQVTYFVVKVDNP